MANYTISAIWKNTNGTITHYAVHKFNEKESSMEQGVKMTKTSAVNLFDNSQNSAITILWDYTRAAWVEGTTVNVVGTATDRYLRTTQDGTVRDNLGHLIDYSFIA
jgi:hypothetical protein